VTAATVQRTGAGALAVARRGATWELADGAAAAARAEPDEVAGWLDALFALRAEAIATDSGAGTPTATVRIEAPSGVQEVAFHRRGGRWWARRAAEPVALALPAAAGPLLDVRADRFASRELFALEPAGLREAIARRGGRVLEHVRRGELVDDWAVVAPAAARADAAAVDRFRHAVARLRGASVASRDDLGQPARTLELWFDPAPGDEAADPRGVRHTLELGRARPDGCAARADHGGVTVRLDAQTCATVGASWLARPAP
jgi:hypothetical protein